MKKLIENLIMLALVLWMLLSVFGGEYIEALLCLIALELQDVNHNLERDE